MNRRIAIYLDDRTTTPLTKVQLNHAYTSKFEILLQRTGDNKSSIAKQLLMHSFEANSIEELKEKISYAAEMIEFKKCSSNRKPIGIGSRIGHVCKRALKAAIDKGYLL